MNQNVIVTKTIAIWALPDQNMYPGFPSRVVAHEIHFSGTDQMNNAEIWIKDYSLGKFRQVTTNGNFTSGVIWSYPAQGLVGKMELCFVNENAEGGNSNVFSCECSLSGDVLTPGVNLGATPASFPWFVPQVTAPAPPPTQPIIAKPGHGKK